MPPVVGSLHVPLTFHHVMSSFFPRQQRQLPKSNGVSVSFGLEVYGNATSGGELGGILACDDVVVVQGIKGVQGM